MDNPMNSYNSGQQQFLTKLEIKEKKKQQEEQLKQLDRIAEFHDNQVGTEFLNPPEKSREGKDEMPRIRINIIGEITKARDFDSDNLYIKYKFQLPNKSWVHDNSDLQETIEKFADLNELQLEDSITHSVSPQLVREKDEGYTTTYNFSFPLDWQMITTIEQSQGKWPIIYIQVNSIDMWQRNRIEGYGFCEIPKTVGFHELTVKTWKPSLNLYNSIHSFFLGGSIKVKEIEEIAFTKSVKNDSKGTILNRFSLSSESGGEVLLRINVSKQAEQYKVIMVEKKKDKVAREEEFEIQSRNRKISGPQLMKTPNGMVSRD